MTYERERLANCIAIKKIPKKIVSVEEVKTLVEAVLGYTHILF